MCIDGRLDDVMMPTLLLRDWAVVETAVGVAMEAIMVDNSVVDRWWWRECCFIEISKIQNPIDVLVVVEIMILSRIIAR